MLLKPLPILATGICVVARAESKQASRQPLLGKGKPKNSIPGAGIRKRGKIRLEGEKEKQRFLFFFFPRYCFDALFLPGVNFSSKKSMHHPSPPATRVSAQCGLNHQLFTVGGMCGKLIDNLLPSLFLCSVDCSRRHRHITHTHITRPRDSFSLRSSFPLSFFGRNLRGMTVNLPLLSLSIIIPAASELFFSLSNTGSSQPSGDPIVKYRMT